MKRFLQLAPGIVQGAGIGRDTPSTAEDTEIALELSAGGLQHVAQPDPVEPPRHLEPSAVTLAGAQEASRHQPAQDFRNVRGGDARRAREIAGPVGAVRRPSGQLHHDAQRVLRRLVDVHPLAPDGGPPGETPFRRRPVAASYHDGATTDLTLH